MFDYARNPQGHAFVPPEVSRELLRERHRREAEAMKGVQDEQRWAWKKEFDAQLDRVVEGMKVVFCPDPAPVDAVAMGAQPGRWNLIWPGYHGAPLNVMALETPDGEFREPGAWVFDMLAENDMWSERVQRDRRRIKREAEEASRRRKEQERAAGDQEVLERFLAATRTQISMNTSTPWSQNVAGRRKAKE